MSKEFLVQMDDSGTIVLPKGLRADWPAGTTFRAQRTDDTIVLKPRMSGERLHPPEAARLKQVSLPAEILSRPGIQHMLNYIAACEARYDMTSDEFYQRYIDGELARDGYLAYWATCYQTLHAPDLATDAAWLDALDAIAETANTIDFGHSLPAIREAIEAPELDPLHTSLLLTEKT